MQLSFIVHPVSPHHPAAPLLNPPPPLVPFPALLRPTLRPYSLSTHILQLSTVIPVFFVSFSVYVSLIIFLPV